MRALADPAPWLCFLTMGKNGGNVDWPGKYHK